MNEQQTVHRAFDACTTVVGIGLCPKKGGQYYISTCRFYRFEQKFQVLSILIQIKHNINRVFFVFIWWFKMLIH